jgi:hypothetical protein
MSITGFAIDATRVRCRCSSSPRRRPFHSKGIGERVARRYRAPVHAQQPYMNILEPGWEQLADMSKAGS